MIKYLTIIATIIIAFSGCTITNKHKVNSNLDFQYIEQEDKRETYLVFGNERLFKLINNKQNIDTDNDTFEDEYQEIEEEFDPLEGYNRFMTSINNSFYTNILEPIARTYKNILPENVRIGISNFFHNLGFPVRFANNLLQFKGAYAMEELGRFTINSTVGVLGFMDPAKKYFDLNKREEDFGQTLGYYGFSEGFHIVLPLLGPSNLRDTLALVPDYHLDVATAYLTDDENNMINGVLETIGLRFLYQTNKASLNLEKYENLKNEALDLYPFLKDIYTQNRRKKIKE